VRHRPVGYRSKMVFSAELKTWRRKRGFSQEQLGFEANVSSRHIAFMETGRAKPSRDMVVRLSEALHVPRSDRNHLLEAAGFAPLYRERKLDTAEMANIRSAIAWMLERHQPYPGFAIDKHWRLVMLNDVARRMLAPFRLDEGASLLESFLAPSGIRQIIENWPQVALYFAQRLRVEARELGGDPVLLKAAQDFAEAAGPVAATQASMPAVLDTQIRIGDQRLSFFSTIAQFGSAEDLALADLRIELLFPADDQTRLALAQSH
jgi:transcriptional regulator with XRE-family HTH domain